MNKETYYLNHIGPGDMGNVLIKIERSFNIVIDNEDLKNVATFKNLCDLIANKINPDHSEICTTQHAFYMLRDALTIVMGIDKCSVKPHTKIGEILPGENRMQVIAEIEDELGFKINLLQPKKWIVTLFSVLLLISVAGCFYNWQIGVAGLIGSLISLKLAGKLGKEMQVKTIGDMANKISKENYLKSKRSAAAINRSEIEQKVRTFLVSDLELEPIALTRKSHFN